MTAFADRVKEAITTTGSGAVTVGASVMQRCVGFTTGHSVGDSGIPYCIEHSTSGEWEIGLGTLASTTSFTRDKVLASSNGNALVNFSSGTKYIFETIPASILNKLARADAVTASAFADSSTATLLIEESGTIKRMKLTDFMTALGTTQANLSAAATLSGGDIISLTQDGVNEVRTTLAALKTYMGGASTPASAITLNGPTSGQVSVASTNFTAALSPSGSTVSSTVTVTPSDGGAGGTFTPASVSLTTGAPSATFTYTPSATTGTKTITLSNNGGLANPAAWSYTATSAPATVSSVTVSPSTASVAGGSTQTFTATVSGTNSPSQQVTWSCTGAGSINATTGVYTAPAATSSAQSATITATSTLDTSKSGTATVTVPAATASVPAAPTIGTATAGDGYVDVAFTGVSGATSYIATLSTGQTATGTSSPIRVTAPDGTAVTAHVQGTNSAGTGPASAESNSVTPAALVDYNIYPYPGNAIKSSVAFTSFSGTGTRRYLSPAAGNYSAKLYWDIDTPLPAAAYMGFGTSPTTPPSVITAADNGSGTKLNGMVAMTQATSPAWTQNAYLWVDQGSGTTNWYAWIVAEDANGVRGLPECINSKDGNGNFIPLQITGA